MEQHYGYHMSAGIAQTKMLAKLASATHKPKQQTVVPRLAVPALLAETPVRALKGMGGKLGDQVTTALPQVTNCLLGLQATPTLALRARTSFKGKV